MSDIEPKLRKRRKQDRDPMQNWWHSARPYWHVISYVVLITFIATTNWTTVKAYADTLAAHDKRLTALEIWQATAAPAQAAMKQEIDDIYNVTVRHQK